MAIIGMALSWLQFVLNFAVCVFRCGTIHRTTQLNNYLFFNSAYCRSIQCRFDRKSGSGMQQKASGTTRNSLPGCIRYTVYGMCLNHQAIRYFLREMIYSLLVFSTQKDATATTLIPKMHRPATGQLIHYKWLQVATRSSVVDHWGGLGL